MDELREVKLEAESEEDVGIQMTNDALDDSVGRLKRKRVEFDHTNLNFAPSKNSRIFENPPKMEPLDDELVDDDSNSSFAPKPEPEEEQGYVFSLTSFLETSPKLKPLEGVQESSSNLAPFFGNLLENQVKQEESYYPTSEQEASYSNLPAKEPKEEPREEYNQQQGSFLNLAPFLEMPVKEEEEEPLPKYTIWDSHFQTTSEQRSFSNLAPFLGNFTEADAKMELIEEKEEEYYDKEVQNPRGSVPIWEQRGPSLGLEMAEVQEEPLDGASWTPDCQLREPKIEEQSGADGSHCCLCGAMGTLQLALTNVPLKSELLILAVGLRLAGKLTIQRGRELMARKQSAYSCLEHYGEAAGRIQKALELEKLDEFLNTPSRDHLAVVAEICPQMTMQRFRERFEEFHKKHRSKRKTINATSRCELCSRNRADLVNVKNKGAKYLLALTSVLQGYRTPAQAVLFAHGETMRRVCPTHHKSTLDVILARLHVRSVDEKPHALHLSILMATVRLIWAKCTPVLFVDTFRWFAKNQVMAVSEDQQLKNDPPIHAYCELCNSHQTYHNLVDVHHQHSKYLLAVSSVLHAYRTPTQAMLFTSGGGDVARRVCATHHRLTVNVILMHLHIRSSDEQPRIDNLLNMMRVVNEIWAECTATVFMNTFRWFAMEQAIGTAVTPPPPFLIRCTHAPKPVPLPVVPVIYACTICPKTSRYARAVTEKQMKLVLLVGECLSQRIELATIRKFMWGDNKARMVCASHFDATIPQIFGCLRIRSLDETPAPEMVHHVMSLVHSISAKRVEYADFIRMVNAFADEYQLHWRESMDELREVKLEDESEEDVGNQMTNDASNGSISNHTIMGTLKRKRVESSEYSSSNFAPSKNSQIFENPPKLEPLDDEIVNDADSNSSFAPKLEPEGEQRGSNLAPFFGNFHENQVKQEEPRGTEGAGYQTLEQGFSFSNFPPKDPKEELVEKGTYETEVYVPIRSSIISTVWDQKAPFSLGLETAEVKEEEPLDRNQDFRCGGPWDFVKEEEPKNAPYEIHQPAVLNEQKLEEQCTSQATLWADYEYEAYETFGYQLEEPKVEKPYLSTGSLSDQAADPLPKYTIWDQRGPSTSQGVYEVKEELFDEQSPCHGMYGVNDEPPMLNEPKLEGQSPDLAGPPTLYCCLCGVVEHPQRPLTNVPVKSELLILAVGLKLAGKLTIKKGRELMDRTQSSYSCQEHYEEAAGRIQTALDVEPLRQGSKKIRRHDLEVVNKICSQMTMERFRERFSEFHKEHHKKKPAVTSHCEICNRDQYRTKMTSVSNKGTKYLLAIADMLQGYRNPAQAVAFASGTHAKKVCIIHFEATLNAILARLNLRSASEQPKAQDLVELMSSVRMVWKDCKTKWFWDTVRWFAVEQQSLKPLMCATPQPPPRRPQSKPKPLPTKPTVPVFLCSLCSKNSPFVRTVQGRNTKLVLAVGACLSYHTTPTSAKEFVASNEPALVCRSHFDSSIYQILATLQIKWLNDSPATGPVLKVMSLVHLISSTNLIGYQEFIGLCAAFTEEDHQLATSR